MTNDKKAAPSGLGRRIQRIVSEKGILKKDFARSIGVSPNYIYQIVAGRRTAISVSLAKLIGTLYGYPPGWVLNGDGDEEE
jgi:transcriptional regulator with XRE-family HTH domain